MLVKYTPDFHRIFDSAVIYKFKHTENQIVMIMPLELGDAFSPGQTTVRNLTKLGYWPGLLQPISVVRIPGHPIGSRSELFTATSWSVLVAREQLDVQQIGPLRWAP